MKYRSVSFLAAALIAGLGFALSLLPAPAYAAFDDCGGVLPFGGVVPAGTYDLTSDCVTIDTLTIEDAVIINGNGFSIDGGNGHAIFGVDGANEKW